MARKLITADFEGMHNHEDWAGFGYLGERRNQTNEQIDAADAKALAAANEAGMTYEELFDWANSKAGRWFADCMFGSDGRHADLYLPGVKQD